MTKFGLDPKVYTLYCLRHSSITRQLVHGVPLQIVAQCHDTSPAQIQAHYARFIDQFGADRVRAAMLKPSSEPAGGRVVRLR